MPDLDSTNGSSDSLAFVTEELSAQLLIYKARRRRDKRKAFALQMGVVALAAASTIFLGVRLSAYWSTSVANLALVCSALVTVLAAAEAFFSHRDLWVLRTLTVRRLEALEREVRYYEAGVANGPVQRERVEDFFTKLGDILEADRRAWETLRGTVERRGGEPQRPGE